jgi:YVTN family beta-propeller protein
MKSLHPIFVSLVCLYPLIPNYSQADDAPPSGKRTRVLPGLQANGSTLLPNQWSLRPAGKQIDLGDFPVNLALHPKGRWLAALHAGFGPHEIVIVDVKSEKIISRSILEQTFYGLCFSPDGGRLFASGGEMEVVHAFDFADGYLSKHREIAIVPVKEKFLPTGLAYHNDTDTLYVAGSMGDAIGVCRLTQSADREFIKFDPGSYPYGCLLDQANNKLLVSLWGKEAVSVIDLKNHKIDATWATDSHPTEMALAPDGKRLFVACANSTRVVVLDTASGKMIESISAALYPNGPSGNTPNSLCLDSDGKVLFVANADANNVAVFNISDPGKTTPLGFIPVGWYPTSVRFDASTKRLYVANGKGLTSRPNPQGPNPNLGPNQSTRDYIAAIFQGTLSIIDLPTPKQMASYSQDAYTCCPMRNESTSHVGLSKGPIPQKIGDPSPIKHVVYIIKENRTYDQVFGDVKAGNGDPHLCLFPESVTPNHHKLAREYVLLDNFFVDGEVSADGHEWSMGAYATDFVEKTWPLNYRPGLEKVPYPSEGGHDRIARPSGGYIWDRCAEAGLTYRSYGEWIYKGKTLKDPGKALVKALEGHFDPWFRGFDLDYSDQKRADRFLKDLARFEKEGAMPQFIVMRLPNDHTSGTKPGKPTPTAYVADNDLALGRVVEGISKSSFWKDTAIFVVEDDAQDGADHVDAHRSVALVISPYIKRRTVDSTMYSTTSMLRTMELILGLKPMSQFDSAARPMVASFQDQPDTRPYSSVIPAVDMQEKNKSTSWGAKTSATFDWTHEDRADPAQLNEIIWRSVKGERCAMPPPVRAAFFIPRPAADRDDDDDDD